MKLGIAGHYTQPATAVGRRAERAEKAGWASIWWPDAQMGYHPRPAGGSNPHETYDWAPLIGAATQHTTTAKLGVGVTDPFRRHPALLAQTAQTLHDMSGGRFVLGLANGAKNNIAPIGLEGSTRIALLEEAIDVMQLLWSSTEPVSFMGEKWSLTDAVLALDSTPFGMPPIWIGGAGPRSLILTGSKADGWLPVMMPVETYAERLAVIRAASVAVGRPADCVTAGSLFMTIAADSAADCHELLDNPWARALALFQPAIFFEQNGFEHPLGHGSSGVLDFIPTSVTDAEYRSLVSAIPLELVEKLALWGDADRIAAELARYEQAGLQHAVIWNVTGIGVASADVVRASYRQLDLLLEHFA